MRQDKRRAHFGWPRWGWRLPVARTPMGQRRLAIYAQLVDNRRKQ